MFDVFLFFALAAILFIGVKPFYIGPKLKEQIAFKANFYGFSILSSGGHFVHQSKTVLAIFVEGHLSNILMNLNEIGPRV